MIVLDVRVFLPGDQRDGLGLARKSAQAAAGLLLSIVTQISLIQCPVLVPLCFPARRWPYVLARGGSGRSLKGLCGAAATGARPFRK